jgi:hypothetical protein
MRKVLILILLLDAGSAFAQQLLISGYAGWQSPTAIDMYYGRYRTTGGVAYGGILSLGSGDDGVFPVRNLWVEAQYNYQRSELSYFDERQSSERFELGNISTHQFLLGVQKESAGQVIRAFGGLSVGLSLLNPENYSGDVRFTAALTGGLKIQPGAAYGFRLQAQLFMPFYFDDVNIGWNPRPGVNTGLTSTTLAVSAAFTAGFYLNLSTIAAISRESGQSENP